MIVWQATVPYIQNVVQCLLLLFGVNFSCYYLLIMKQVKSVYEDEELRLYVGNGAGQCAFDCD